MKRLKKILQSKFFWIIWIVIIILSSFLRVEVFAPSSKYRGDEKEFIAQVLSYQIDGDKLSITIEEKEKIIGTYYIKNKKEKEMLEQTLQVGDIYDFSGTLLVPSDNTVPNNFNYKKYLNRQKIFYLLQIDTLKFYQENKSIKYQVKNAMQKRIDQIDDSGYFNTFILGNKDDLNENAVANFGKNGISHLFAISGMHVSLFASILLLLLKKFGQNFSVIFTIVFLWLYAILIGLPISIVRATLSFSLLSLAKMFSFKIKPVYVSLIAASIILIIYPAALFQVGFQFSFLTSFGLLYDAESFQGKSFLQASWKTSIIAFLWSFPITIYHFYEVNFMSVFWNMIFIPLVSFIIYPLSLISFIFPFLIPLFHISTTILEWLNMLCAKINIFTFCIPKIQLILLAMFLLLLLLGKYYKKCWLFFGTLIFIWMLLPYFHSSAYIYFIDVGQGDSALIVTPYRKHVYLVDTGGKITYAKEYWAKRKKEYHISDATITLMKSLGISKVDTMFLSHGDADHAKEALYLLDNVSIKNIVLNKGLYNSIEQEIIKKYPTKIVGQNHHFDHVTIWNPIDYHDENDNSMYLLFSFGQTTILFTGDGSIKTEKDFIKDYPNHIDILKVGHHGSKTSSSASFIHQITPTYSIISVGKNNKYGHPNKEVLDSLEESKIYRTDQNGSIMFQIKNNKLKIETCAS